MEPIALFGEKYPEIARVVKIVDKKESDNILSSIEFVEALMLKILDKLGFKLLSDISVSSGVRRIEALTGQDAHDYVDDKINFS